MRHPFSAFAKVAFALFALVLGQTTGCGRAGVVAQLTETADPVFVNGVAVQAAPSASRPLVANDVMEVRKGGMARIVYPDGSRFLLLPDGQDPATLKIQARSSETGRVLLDLVGGALSFVVPEDRSTKDRFDVRGQHTVTSIDGTEGRVVSSPGQDSTALERGEVTVRAREGPATTRLHAMQEATLKPGEASFRVSTYDPMAPAEARFHGRDRTQHGF